MQEQISSERTGNGRGLRSQAPVLRGDRIAGESRLSLYLPDSLLPRNYVWRGDNNPLAARLKARLAELGIS